MSYNNLAITNVVNVQVAQPPAGLTNYQINNLALFTKEVPANAAITQAAPGIYLSPADVADDFGVNSETYAQANAIFSQQPNILDGGGSLIVYPMGSGDTLTASINALNAKMFFGGAIWGGYAPSNIEIEAASTACQPLRKLLFVVSTATADLSPGGLFPTVAAATETQSRLFLYTLSALSARIAVAAYASRLMSTNFDGSNTTATMQMKDLITILPDSGITQAVLTSCEIESPEARILTLSAAMSCSSISG